VKITGHWIAVVSFLLLSACSDNRGPQLFPADAAPADLSQWQLMQVDTSSEHLLLDPAVLSFRLAPSSAKPSITRAHQRLQKA